MPIDFEAVKRLPADEQVKEYKRILAALQRQIAEIKQTMETLEKDKKSDERDAVLEKTRTTFALLMRDRNTAEQLLARSEIEEKALETVLREAKSERKEDDERDRLRERQELENIVAQERKRDDERKVEQLKKPEDAYKPRQGYESESVYNTLNKFYETTGPLKPQQESQAYKTKEQQQREEEVIRGMYTGSDQGPGYRG